MKNELVNLYKIVKEVLTEVPETRDSDDLLYAYVLRKCGESVGIAFMNMRVNEFLVKANEYGAPKRDTITRERRKIQRDCPELTSTKRIKQFRSDLENEYKEFNRSEIC